MNPFDGNPASIPLDSIVRTIEINVLQTLNSSSIPDPFGAVDGEYLLQKVIFMSWAANGARTNRGLQDRATFKASS
ncbi:hypothetical protein GCM10028808_71310 [Spirosoma migulaei]